MSSYIVRGGVPLTGQVTISGNKNAALPCLAATLLTNEKITLTKIPRINDVFVMIELLRFLGSTVEWVGQHTVEIVSSIEKHRFSQDILPVALVDSIRASILLIGPLLCSCKKILLPPPGGDVIGFRRLDAHFLGLEALGASCQISEDGYLDIEVRDTLVGHEIFLEEASVTATENIVMAAVCAKGITTIRNAASEPHVQDLCVMLNKMGAKIAQIGSNVLIIEGVSSLKGCKASIGPDYMEMGSFVGLAAATRGEIELTHIDGRKFPMIARGFEKIGIHWIISGENSLIIPANQRRTMQRSLDGGTQKIDDAPWPAFPADLMSIITVVATQMTGSMLIHEKMYESRLYFIDWLIRMGADIIMCDPHRAVINGPSQLKGATVESPDVRAGMALVIAALCAQGETTIQNIYHIERGYEALLEKLIGVGASIEKIL